MVSIIEQKFNKFSVNLLSEINDLIHLEVMKKQKENLRSSVLHERQKHVIKLDYKCHKTNKTCHSVIVCFTSFKHRTSTYRNRNILKDVRVKLDLTKKKYNISKSARSIADEKQDTMSLQILIAD